MAKRKVSTVIAPGAKETHKSFQYGEELTPKQKLAMRLVMTGPATHILLRGGSRSGKTFLIVRSLILRALNAPFSSHVCLRYRFNALRESIIEQTVPKVMRVSFPNVPWNINQSDWTMRFGEKGNEDKFGSVLFGGLDDKERTEKILGQEHASVHLNECSQISYGARNKVVTRMAQKVFKNDGALLPLRAYYDENPPGKGHWTYRMWFEHVEPLSRRPLARPENYVTMKLNPEDNIDNIDEAYVELLQSLPAREQKRFLEGEFADVVDGALWSQEMIDTTKRLGEVAADQIRDKLVELVIAVDPSGCSGEEDYRSDEIGIVAAGKDAAGIGYILEDASGRMSPLEWGAKAVELYKRWRADRIIAEQNYGGAMVEAVLRSADSAAPIRLITASRGKVIRAEPVAALYEKNRVVHIEDFLDLEEQMCSFARSGYMGMRSPDRADAAIWALTDLLVPADNSMAMLTVAREQMEGRETAIEATKNIELVLMTPPKGTSCAYGQYGKQYNLDEAGLMRVDPDDAKLFRAMGFVAITANVNTNA
jgi:phage terminase large subunit-like protein